MSKQIFCSLGMLCMLLAINVILKKKTKAFLPFSIMQFLIGYGICVTVLIDPIMGSNFQHLAKTTAPFQYLYGPFFYFFWIYLFKPNRKIKWYDGLHAMPFLINIINYIPFYTLSANQKLKIALDRSYETTTFFPIPNEYMIKIFLITIYAVIALAMHLGPLNTILRRASKRNKFIAKWLVLDVVLKLLTVLTIFLNETFFIGKQNFNIAYLFYSIDSIMNIFIVYLYPFVLKGFRGTLLDENFYAYPHKISTVEIKESDLNKKENALLAKLHNLLEVGRLFKDEDLSAKTLAKKLQCSEAKLEELVLKRFDASISSLIDIYRVNYLETVEKKNEKIQKLNKAEKALIAGFKTQIAMDAAIKKFGSLKN